jgi:hypothetical protein
VKNKQLRPIQVRLGTVVIVYAARQFSPSFKDLVAKEGMLALQKTASRVNRPQYPPVALHAGIRQESADARGYPAGVYQSACGNA